MWRDVGEYVFRGKIHQKEWLIPGNRPMYTRVVSVLMSNLMNNKATMLATMKLRENITSENSDESRWHELCSIKNATGETKRDGRRICTIFLKGHQFISSFLLLVNFVRALSMHAFNCFYDIEVE